MLLASTAVPVWARSRTFLGPIFVTTATATGPRRGAALPSLLYLTAGAMFRYAWVEAGARSARDDQSVAEMARSQ